MIESNHTSIIGSEKQYQKLELKIDNWQRADCWMIFTDYDLLDCSQQTMHQITCPIKIEI